MKPTRSVPIAYILPGWLRTPILPIYVGTEIRVIFPALLLVLALVAAARLLGDDIGQAVSLLGYGLGCAALGSIVAGRDFVHRMVGTILSQPCSRARLWWTRLSVSLSGMVLLAMLAGVNWLELPGATAHAPISATVICLAPVFSGLFVAPWLTLLCRSPLAGTVFTVALPFGFWTLSEAMALARFGFDYTASSETVNFKAGVMGFMLLAHWAGGAVCGWRKFRRLEAIEGRVGELHLPRWLSRQHPAKSVTRPSKSGHPLWGLVKKELRLQQIAFFTAGIFLLVWLCWWQIHRLRPDLGSTFIDAGTFLYVGLLPLLIGAVASAEERQLGTAEWQILLPVAARKQWMIKVAVLLALSIILAVLLPVGALGLFSWGGDFKEGLLSLTMVFCGAAVALTTMSLYISSACNNGLKAMLVSLPVAVALLALIGIAFKSYLALSELGTGEDSLGKWLAVSAPPILLLGLFLLTSHLPW